jgi:hypothetical protein
MKKLCIAFAVVVVTALTSFGQERYLKPVDEGTMDPSFVAFRSKVIAAAERRDAKFIYSIIDPKIAVSFGGDDGIRNFKKWFKLEKRSDPFWTEFLTVLKNGGLWARGDNGKRTNLFYAPYTFNGFPEDLDAFEHGVVFGNNVALRKTASPDGELVGRLSYNIVKADFENSIKKGDDLTWVKVTTLGGMNGYVNADYYRSPIDYRAGFEKKRGLWKMVAFISGD